MRVKWLFKWKTYTNLKGCFVSRDPEITFFMHLVQRVWLLFYCLKLSRLEEEECKRTSEYDEYACYFCIELVLHSDRYQVAFAFFSFCHMEVFNCTGSMQKN